MPGTSTNGQACPVCGGKAISIMNGLPLRPDLFDQADRGEIVLGGCMVTGFDPKLQCAACGHLWGEVSQQPFVDEE